MKTFLALQIAFKFQIILLVVYKQVIAVCLRATIDLSILNF